MSNQPKCLIWRTDCKVLPYKDDEKVIIDSPRIGAKYIVSRPFPKYNGQVMDIKPKNERARPFNDEEKIRLSGYIAKQNLNGITPDFEILWKDENWLERIPSIPNPRERAYLLLEGLVKKSDSISKEFDNETFYSGQTKRSKIWNFFKSLSCCKNDDEIIYLIDYLEKCEFINKKNDFRSFEVTVKGFEAVHNVSNLNSKTAFIAMWITSSEKNPKQHKIMETIYGCIKEAVTQSWYEPLRIDQKEHVNKIDDEILSEIKKARFIVCDLTSEKNKPRGSVYFEAGYALGKNIPIIWTCDNNLSQNLSFDIRQYNCLFWEKDKLEEFRKKLKHRIENIIGEGPLKPTDQTQQET